MCAHHILDEFVTALLFGVGPLGALRRGLGYLLANARRANLNCDRSRPTHPRVQTSL